MACKVATSKATGGLVVWRGDAGGAHLGAGKRRGAHRSALSAVAVAAAGARSGSACRADPALLSDRRAVVRRRLRALVGLVEFSSTPSARRWAEQAEEARADLPIAPEDVGAADRRRDYGSLEAKAADDQSSGCRVASVHLLVASRGRLW